MAKPSLRASGGDLCLFLCSLASLPVRRSPRKNKVKRSWSSDCRRRRRKSPLAAFSRDSCPRMRLGGSEGRRRFWNMSPDLQPDLTFEPLGCFWQERRLCLIHEALARKHIMSPPCALPDWFLSQHWVFVWGPITPSPSQIFFLPLLSFLTIWKRRFSAPPPNSHLPACSPLHRRELTLA